MRNRTADLLLTMETLYLLSYRGMPAPHSFTSLRARYRRTKIHTQAQPKPIDWGIHGAGPRDGSGGLGQAEAGAKNRGPRSRTAMSGPLGVAGVGFEPA